MATHAFPKIGRIKYEGPSSKNPLAFKHYNPDEKVEGKKMKDHLRFAVVYWHTMRGAGADMFGGGTARRPWNTGECSPKEAVARAHAFFELVSNSARPSTRSTIAISRPTARR